MINIRLVIDEAALKNMLNLAQPLLEDIELNDIYIEEGRCFSIVSHIQGKKLKVKLIPETQNGKFSLKIFKIFATGINIDLSGVMSLFKKQLEKVIKDFPIEIKNSSIIFDIDSNFAGISDNNLVINFRK